MTTLNFIADSLRDSLSRYAANELAYYALTSKIENQIRDGLAWTMHDSLASGGMVAREFNRIDIAIIKEGSIEDVKDVIELKSMYSFDIVSERNIKIYVNEIENDYIKRQSYVDKGADFYSISIVVHPMCPIPVRLDGIVKYSKGINAALRKWNEIELMKIASDRWISVSEKSGFSIIKIEHHAGSAFNIPVSLSFYVKRKRVM